jgi:hypothetical protein
MRAIAAAVYGSDYSRGVWTIALRGHSIGRIEPIALRSDRTLQFVRF